jgi:CDP-paratose 2-epimerase
VKPRSWSAWKAQNEMNNVLITGGAGFIGSNLAHRLVTAGHRVTVFDNLSRRGATANLEWLRTDLGDRFHFVRGDVRDWDAVRQVTVGVDHIYHLASQVAVTLSVMNPREDFEINALGTLNLIEAARTVGHDPILIYASTNKVYGALDDVGVAQGPLRYHYLNLPSGVPETYPLDFHSPYGCSKGAGDQYTRDYARIYHLRTVVFRQSCIYGPRQFGVEDQGWVAYLLIAATLGWPITIYGDGKQVRDLLHVDDLIDAYEMAIEHIDVTAGRVYNLGGGPRFSLAIWAEFGPLVAELIGHPLPVTYAGWRPGDQKVFIADIRRAAADFGWRPAISPQEGIPRLLHWIQAHRSLFEIPRPLE